MRTEKFRNVHMRTSWRWQGTAVRVRGCRRLPPALSGNRTLMSTYPDPASHGDVHPSEEEIDPAGASGPVGGYASRPGPQPSPAPGSRPVPGPARPVTAARSIVSRRPDGSVEVVTDFDGDGIADVVQLDLGG